MTVIWKSQLQTEIELSIRESECTGLSYAIRETIPIMELLKEMKDHRLHINLTKEKVKFRVFEDNSGAIEITCIDKYRTHTKHPNNRLHQLQIYVYTKSR